MATQSYKEDNTDFKVISETGMPVADKLTILQSKKTEAYNSLYKLINAVDIDWNNARLNSLITADNERISELVSWGGENVNSINIPEHAHLNKGMANWQYGYINNTGEVIDLLDYLLNRTLYFDNEIVKLVVEGDLTPIDKDTYLYYQDTGELYDNKELQFYLLDASGTSKTTTKTFILRTNGGYDGTIEIDNQNPSICTVSWGGWTSKDVDGTTIKESTITITPVSTVKWENVPAKYKNGYVADGNAPTIDYSNLDVPAVSNTITNEISIKYVLPKTSQYGSYTGYIYVKTLQVKNGDVTLKMADETAKNQVIVGSKSELKINAKYLYGDNNDYRILPKFEVIGGGEVLIEYVDNAYKYYYQAPETVENDTDKQYKSVTINMTVDYPDSTYDLTKYNGEETIFTGVQRINNEDCSASLTLNVFDPLQQQILFNDTVGIWRWDAKTNNYIKGEDVSIDYREDIYNDEHEKSGEIAFITVNADIYNYSDNKAPYILFNQYLTNNGIDGTSIARTLYCSNDSNNKSGFYANIQCELYGYTNEPLLDDDNEDNYNLLGYVKHANPLYSWLINNITTKNNKTSNDILSYLNYSVYTKNNTSYWSITNGLNSKISFNSSTVQSTLNVLNESVAGYKVLYNLDSANTDYTNANGQLGKYTDEWYSYAIIKLSVPNHFSGEGTLYKASESYLYIKIKRSPNRLSIGSDGNTVLNITTSTSNMYVNQTYNLKEYDIDNTIYYYNGTKSVFDDKTNAKKYYEIAINANYCVQYWDFSGSKQNYPSQDKWSTDKKFVNAELTNGGSASTTKIKVSEIYTETKGEPIKLTVEVTLAPDKKFDYFTYNITLPIIKRSLPQISFYITVNKTKYYANNFGSGAANVIEFENNSAPDFERIGPAIYEAKSSSSTGTIKWNELLEKYTNSNMFALKYNIYKDDVKISTDNNIIKNASVNYFSYSKPDISNNNFGGIGHEYIFNASDFDDTVIDAINGNQNIYKIEFIAGETYICNESTITLLFHKHSSEKSHT